MRIAGIGARDGIEQEREVARRAPHGAIGGELVKEDVPHRVGRHTPEGRAKAVDVAEGRRIAQGAMKSDPSATDTKRAASAAAAPPLDPPAVRERL